MQLAYDVSEHLVIIKHGICFFLNLAHSCLTLDTFPTAQSTQYICLYMLKTAARKMPQPGKALLSTEELSRQAAPREELMLSECTEWCATLKKIRA